VFLLKVWYNININIGSNQDIYNSYNQQTQIESIAIKLLYGSNAGVENVLIPISHSIVVCYAILINHADQLNQTIFKSQDKSTHIHHLTTIAPNF